MEKQVDEEKIKEIRQTLLNNADKITKKRWYPDAPSVANKIWITGEIGSDKIRISYQTQGTRRNPENYSKGEWTLGLSLIKDHGWQDIRTIPIEEMEEDERDGLLYAAHENLQTHEFTENALKHRVTIW